MVRFFGSLLLVSAAVVHGADYPSIPIERLLSSQQQIDLRVGQMTAAQKEALRRTIIDAYRTGFERGKQEGEKTSLRRGTTPSVIESQIDGDFEGWEGETIVKLINGQIWQQSEYRYEYHYAFMPEVLIYRSGGGYKMKVEGTDEAVGVIRLR